MENFLRFFQTFNKTGIRAWRASTHPSPSHIYPAPLVEWKNVCLLRKKVGRKGKGSLRKGNPSFLISTEHQSDVCLKVDCSLSFIIAVWTHSELWGGKIFRIASLLSLGKTRALVLERERARQTHDGRRRQTCWSKPDMRQRWLLYYKAGTYYITHLHHDRVFHTKIKMKMLEMVHSHHA